MLDPLSRFIDRLAAGGWDPIATGADSWESRCPGHNGQTKRNLSITTGEGGRVLVNCHCVPKCPPEAIVATLGLTMADLFAENPARNGHMRANGKAERGTKESTVEWFIEKVLKLDLMSTSSTYWSYRGADGQDVFHVVRIDPGNGQKKTYRPVSHGPRGWVLKDPVGLDKLPLYNLPDLANAEIVYVSEGEKCSGKVKLIGLTGTTSSHGAEAPHKTDWTPLAGKQVVILPDNDKDGECYAASVCGILATLSPPPVTRIVRLKDFWGDATPLPDGGDIADWLIDRKSAGWTAIQMRAELERVVAAIEPEKAQVQAKKDRAGDKEKKKSQTEIILDLVDESTIFRDDFKRSYIVVSMYGHDEIYSIKSDDFRNFLIHTYEEIHDKPPSSSGIDMAISVLNSRGWAKREADKVHVRVAGNDDLICIDLADSDRRSVAINKIEWRIINNPPFRFCRPQGMSSLMLPERGGSLKLLRPFVNCSDKEFLLVIAYITAALRPEGPYPVMALVGEQGSAKTTLARLLKLLVDPNHDDIRAEPKDPRDMMITATHSRLVAYDNISSVPSWMSDALCRIVMGAGYTTRSLYTNDDEFHFYAQRPIVLNGITDYVTRPDLVDRCLFIHLLTIPEEKRKTVRQFERELRVAAPKILGAIYDAISAGMRLLPDIDVSGLCRMADFAIWGEAVVQGMGEKPGEFMRIYAENRKEADETLIDDSTIATVLREFVSGNRTDWKGTVGQLLQQINLSVADTDQRKKSKDWPMTARGLTSAINRFKPALRAVGVMIEQLDRSKLGKLVRIWREDVDTQGDKSNSSDGAH